MQCHEKSSIHWSRRPGPWPSAEAVTRRAYRTRNPQAGLGNPASPPGRVLPADRGDDRNKTPGPESWACPGGNSDGNSDSSDSLLRRLSLSACQLRLRAVGHRQPGSGDSGPSQGLSLRLGYSPGRSLSPRLRLAAACPHPAGGRAIRALPGPCGCELPH